MRRSSQLAVLLALPLAAQDPVPEGHSMHGGAFNEGPRQAAYVMAGMNDAVHFPVSTSARDAQVFFDQGVVQLHGFWYFEAERSFRQVAAIDPECAMAYWGMAMANVENETRARDFAHRAWRGREGATDRERRYIEALARFHDADTEELAADWTPPKGADDGARRERYVADLEALIGEYPDDVEAKAFLVNQLWLDQREGGRRISSKQANQALLDQVFAANPMHPAHHYVVHLWDTDATASRAVHSAAVIGHSAPGIAHMWHMGGHVWARLDRHADAAWLQEASARVDHAHMMRDSVMPDQIHNYAHNNEWLCRSLRHVGRVHDAIALACNMIELPRHPEWNSPDDGSSSAGYGRKRLIEVLETFECWDEVDRLVATGHLDCGDDPLDRSLVVTLLGKAAAARGDVARLHEHIAELDALEQRAKQERAAAVDDAEAEALDDGENEADVQKALAETVKQRSRPVRTIQTRQRLLDGLLDCAEGRYAGGLEKLEKARLDAGWLARLLLDAGRTDDAIDKVRKVAERAKGEAKPLADLALVLHRAGKPEEAAEAFGRLRSLSAAFDLEFPPFARLAPLAQQLGHGADWRVAASTPDDVGERPDLASLGPFRWSPVPARDFALPTGLGTDVVLSRYDQPVLVVFFLGFGCVHCVEQLKALAPAVERFRELGIAIVAVGTDSAEELAASHANAPPEERYAFPIGADPGLTVFRQWRCHDDFEGQPLHGTFLVDGAGLVRWQDIGHEPFMDIEFLIAECRRLLAIPVEPLAPEGVDRGG